MAGNPAVAERDTRAACENFEARGEKGWLSTMAAILAEALYVQGRLDEAEAAALVGKDRATSDDHDAQALWRWVQAKVLARRGQLDEAERLAREAVEVIDRTDEVNNQAQVRTGLAEVLRLARRPEEAIEVLEQAVTLYEWKGNLVMAEKTRALLGELGASASPET
jgi:tetratricopeptide (TPR) repeat protein